MNVRWGEEASSLPDRQTRQLSRSGWGRCRWVGAETVRRPSVRRRRNIWRGSASVAKPSGNRGEWSANEVRKGRANVSTDLSQRAAHEKIGRKATTPASYLGGGENESMGVVACEPEGGSSQNQGTGAGYNWLAKSPRLPEPTCRCGGCVIASHGRGDPGQ